MRFKNAKEKIKFIEDLYEDDNQSVKKKIPILSRLSQDRNPDVRVSLASQLVLFDHTEIEDILYNMLFDKNRMVRLEALDALAVGRQTKSIEKVKTMLYKEGCLIRAYAVSTLFSLIANCYGVNKSAFKKYEEAVAKSYLTEKNPRVRLEYYRNQFFMDNEKGLFLLENSYMEAVEREDYGLIWTFLHIFREIRNRNNKERVNEILNHKVERLLPAQRELAIEIIRNHILSRVLIVDKDDAYLSHIVSSVLRSMNIPDTEISTAGFDTGTVRKEEILAFCEKQGIQADDTYYSKRITDAYLYDYIVCLNNQVDEELFALCKTIYYDGINWDDEKQIMGFCQNIRQTIQF